MGDQEITRRWPKPIIALVFSFGLLPLVIALKIPRSDGIIFALESLLVGATGSLLAHYAAEACSRKLRWREWVVLALLVAAGGGAALHLYIGTTDRVELSDRNRVLTKLADHNLQSLQLDFDSPLDARTRGSLAGLKQLLGEAEKIGIAIDDASYYLGVLDLELGQTAEAASTLEKYLGQNESGRKKGRTAQAHYAIALAKMRLSQHGTKEERIELLKTGYRHAKEAASARTELKYAEFRGTVAKELYAEACPGLSIDYCSELLEQVPFAPHPASLPPPDMYSRLGPNVWRLSEWDPRRKVTTYLLSLNGVAPHPEYLSIIVELSSRQKFTATCLPQLGSKVTSRQLPTQLPESGPNEFRLLLTEFDASLNWACTVRIRTSVRGPDVPQVLAQVAYIRYP